MNDAPTPLPISDTAQPFTESARISVVEEQLHVGKDVVETGRVRISKRIHETTEHIDLPLIREEYDIERIPVNAYVTQAPAATRYEGDTLVIPVLQEVVVTETRLLLVEEIRLTKRQVHSRLTQDIPLRREEVSIEREDVTPHSESFPTN